MRKGCNVRDGLFNRLTMGASLLLIALLAVFVLGVACPAMGEEEPANGETLEGIEVVANKSPDISAMGAADAFDAGTDDVDPLKDNASEDASTSVGVLTAQSDARVDGNIVQVAIGDDHSAALTSTGELWMWGRSSNGQLGNGADMFSEDELKPIRVLSGIKQVSLGSGPSAAITYSGELWTWGTNLYGELGDGTTDYRYTPVKIMDGVAHVTMGDSHSAAITDSGELWMWGENNYGQLGDGTTEDRHSPVKVMEGVAQVSLGSYHSSAITTTGELWMWGNNDDGQIGDGTNEDRSLPVKVLDNVTQASLGGHFSAAITGTGELWLWGYNGWGQVGTGDTWTSTYRSPVKVMSDVAQVSLGFRHSAAVTNSGELWLWGSNEYGALGTGSYYSQSESPVKVMDGVAQVSLGDDASAVLTESGEVWTWGVNEFFGQLGNGTKLNRNAPFCIFRDGEWLTDDSLALSGHSMVQNDDVVIVDCHWSDDWLSRDSTAYNHDFAKTMSVLMSAAYSKDAASKSLETLGCDKDTVDLHFPTDADYGNGINRVAYTFGNKSMADGTPVVFVLVRGTPGNIEWESNFNVANYTYPNPYHEGFQKAYRLLKEDLESYCSDRGIDSSAAKFVVTGHSRGAAVANLLGSELNKGAVTGANGSSKAANTYVYTFAAPQCTTASDMRSSFYSNIFNIVNPEDIVPRLPLSKWKFGRYGQDLFLPSKSSSGKSLADLKNRMTMRFWRIAEEGYMPYSNGVQTAKRFEEAFAGDVKTTEAYLHDKLYYYTKSASVGPVPIWWEKRGGFTVSEAMQSLGCWMGGNGKPVKNGPDIPLSEVFAGLLETKPKMAVKLLAAVLDESVDINWMQTLVNRGLSIDARFTIGSSFEHAHSTDAYMAWMLEGEYDVSNGKSFFVDGYTSVKIACPVDIEVRDGDGELVCYIAGDEVDEDVMAQDNGLAASVENGVKTIDVPSDGTYSFAISATDAGTMDIACEELDGEGNKQSQVAYKGLKLIEGESYNLAVDEEEDDDEVVANWVSLRNSSGNNVKPSVSLSGDQLEGLTLELLVGSGEGVTDGPETMSRGDQVTIHAVPAGDWEFEGWYEGGKLVSEDPVWTFFADADRSLEARFSEAFDNPFKDVTEETAHYDDILWLAEQGISTGWNEADGTRTFRPLANVKRCDMAAFLFRLAKQWGVLGASDSWAPKASTKAKFLDVDASTSHSQAIWWMAENGISTGWDAGRGKAEFKPLADVKRADLAAFLGRLASKAERGGVSAINKSAFKDVSSSTAHCKEIWWMAENGISTGWQVAGGAEFRPFQNVKRADMAAFLHRLDGVK